MHQEALAPFRRLAVVTAVAFASTNCAARPSQTSTASPSSGPSASSCAMYRAAFAYVLKHHRRPAILADTVSTDIPHFAHPAWTFLDNPPEHNGETVPLRLRSAYPVFPDSGAELVVAAARNGGVLPRCLGEGRFVQRVPIGELRSVFVSVPDSDGMRFAGWAQFERAYPHSDAFLFVSPPVFELPDSSQALVYVGCSFGPVAGVGRLLRMSRRSEEWRVEIAWTVWVS